jgi:hypothetical protein
VNATKYVYETEEQVIEAGTGFERARYWRRIRDIAEEAIAEYPHDEEARREYAEQDVDGTDYVIYTHKQLTVLRFTQNDDAYEEIYGGVEHVDQTQIVYWAMLADVMEEIESILPEEDSEEETEDEE